MKYKLITIYILVLFGSICKAQDNKEGKINFNAEKGYYEIEYWSDQTSSFQETVYVPGDQVIPEVLVDVVFDAISGTYRYRYTVINTEKSKQSLFSFSIDIKTPIWEIESPSPEWYGRYIGWRNECRWAKTGGGISGIPPGDTLSGYQYTSSDPPGIVYGFASSPAWLGFPDDGPAGPMRRRLDSLQHATRHVKFKTVGPRKLPDNITPPALLDTLTSYLEFSCETTWISVPGVCRSLRTTLEEAKGRHRPARGVLQAFLNEVEALPEEQLSPEARALLFYSGRFLLWKLEGER